MCLIVASPKGNFPPIKTLIYAFDHNKDGWGVVYRDKKRNVVQKGFDLDELIEVMYGDVIGKPFILHLRWATHGKCDRTNCHPFKIADGVYMAHNGVINNIAITDESKSDTWHFAEHLTSLYGKFKGWFWGKDFDKTIEEWMGGGNKLAFMRANGKIHLVNGKAGFWYGGMWFSNTYSLPLTYPPRPQKKKETGTMHYVWSDKAKTMVLEDEPEDSLWSRYYPTSKEIAGSTVDEKLDRIDSTLKLVRSTPDKLFDSVEEVQAAIDDLERQEEQEIQAEELQEIAAELEADLMQQSLMEGEGGKEIVEVNTASE